MTTRRNALGALSVGVALLVGCGGSSASTGGTTTTTLSPLSAIFGSPDEEKDRQRKVEQAMVDCMRDKGWKYVPQDVDKMFGNTDGGVFSDQAKFREKYGYGISLQPDPGVMGGGSFTDPNSDYVQTLSQSDQEKYYADLQGPPMSDPPNMGSDTVHTMPPLADRKGCQADAERKVGARIFEDPKFDDFMSKLSSDGENDPRMQAAEAKWSACMKEAGFIYTKQQNVYDELQKKLQTLEGIDPNSMNGGMAAPATMASASAGIASGGISSDTTVLGGAIPIDGNGGNMGNPLDKVDNVELKKLQDLELATAKADGACADKFLKKLQTTMEKEMADKLLKQFPTLKKK